MKTLYFDCGMGAAGDMLTAALLELLPNPDDFIEKLNSLGIPGVVFEKEASTKCGIVGTHVSVKVQGTSEDEMMEDMEHVLGIHRHAHVQEYHDGHGEHSHAHVHECHDELHHELSHEQCHGHVHNTHDGHSHSHVHHEHSGHAHEHVHDEHGGHSHGHIHHEHGGHFHEHVHDEHGEHSHKHVHSHYGLHEIEHIVSHFSISKKVKQDIFEVYALIAEAESHAHGVPVSQIHFHEVGNMDAIADVTAVCMLMDEISPDEVVVSPIHVGWGQVKCAHGILPVPAPATAYILRNVPVYGGTIKGELCTPTGAALLKHFATRFGQMPVMAVQQIGYGMGKKDFEKANCVRAMLGETFNTAGNISSNANFIPKGEDNNFITSEGNADSIVELSCNVDDMTGEAIGFAMEQLLAEGAVDVYTIPIGMKKSRPGTLIRVMCKEQDKGKMTHLLFKHTTTIGIRETLMHRYVLKRSVETVATPWGEVHCKISEGYGVHRHKYEYEDLARIAREHHLSIDEILKTIHDTTPDF